MRVWVGIAIVAEALAVLVGFLSIGYLTVKLQAWRRTVGRIVLALLVSLTTLMTLGLLSNYGVDPQIVVPLLAITLMAIAIVMTILFVYMIMVQTRKGSARRRHGGSNNFIEEPLDGH